MIYTDFPDMEALKSYATAMNARARQLGIKGRLTATLLRSVILESAGQCGWCGINLYKEEFEIDHIHPLSKNGAHSVDNIVMTCVPCNRRKGDKLALKFALEIAAQNDTLSPLVRRLLEDNNIDPLHQHKLF